MQVTKEGSVRVDLVGGTLDLEPINLILPNVVTLNVATSLKAKVKLSKRDDQKIIIKSLDYNKTYEFQLNDLASDALYFEDKFKEMTFVLQILSEFDLNFGLDIGLESGAPAGSGLGGSSAMGATLYGALCDLLKISSSVDEIVQKVKGIEGRILNKGMPGYQDYYPALTGGVLALKGVPGKIHVEQMFSEPLVEYLEKNITLVYSGISRNSGINNWDVYKAFFDGDKIVRGALAHIAELSFLTYTAISEKRWTALADLIAREGEARKKLSPGIVPGLVDSFFQDLKGKKIVHGLKMCGAGGGGCFILTHAPENKHLITEELVKNNFKELPFKIEKPINERF